MMKHALMVMLAVSGALAPSMASAQWKWGHESEPGSGVCFYKDPEFRGDYFCARDGESEKSMPSGMNDKISSIRVFGSASVTVYQDSKFEGRSSRFDFDVPDLHREGWNDLISSFRVGGGWGHDHGHGGGYHGDGYHGDADAIVRRAYEDVLNREPDSQGMRIYRSHIIDDGWSEQQVRQSLRESQEFRTDHMMTAGKAQEIVRQAYLSVLHREPDAAAGGYVNNVLNRHWTQGDVERELRKSDEYRHRR
jgi:hypothetical protein